MTRRDLIMRGAAAGALTLTQGNCRSIFRNTANRRVRGKVIVLGFDGMDPKILDLLMSQGKLPAFRRLKEEGDYRRLDTSLPPQSPVAWSNFITGMDPGGHGIFDFIHRNPADYSPYLSTSRVVAGDKKISLGDYVLPVSPGKIELLRKGRAFWQILEDHDIPASIVQIPSNFPPAATSQRTLAGMGTPDILGTYGMFSFYTTAPWDAQSDLGGGSVIPVKLENQTAEMELTGPANTFRKNSPPAIVRFKAFVDPENPVIKVSLPEQEFILREGEWSEWKRIQFRLVPTQSVSGICRFYLKQAHPDFKLYVSPINIDPSDPALPISTPANYSRELAAAIGPFFTKGLPADTKALDQGVLSEAEFLAQDEMILSESRKLFDYELGRFDSGFWFHYFSSTDQRQHMFLPGWDPARPPDGMILYSDNGRIIQRVYEEMDDVLGSAMAKADRETLLLVMSDHGFMPFRRALNLNTWLLQNGYLRILDPALQEQAEYHSNTDWTQTRAYALGLNAIYVNEKGREGMGIVPAGSEKEALIDDLAGRLEEIVDFANGEKVITRAYKARQSYHSSELPQAPDIIVGYNKGYRASWATPLGKIPRGILENNAEKWGADHCMDPQFLPGILLANRKIRAENPTLCDLTATILEAFEIPVPPEMVGKNIL
jgi:predicted AlkP superfamily phosphohydrolase/phosphomutase